MGTFWTSVWEQVSTSSVVANIIIVIIVWPIGLLFWWSIDKFLTWLNGYWKFLSPKQKQWFKTHRGISGFFYRLHRKAKREKKF